MRSKDPAKGMELFLKSALLLAEKIRDHSRDAGRLIGKLEKTTDFRTLIEQEQGSYSRFRQESEGFARSVRGFAEDFPKVMVDLRTVISALLRELEATGYIITKKYPTFHITFNKKSFGFSVAGTKKSDLKGLEKEEYALVKDIAEIISLDYHIEKTLEEINATIKERRIIRLCKRVEKDGTRIDELHLIVIWWKEIKDRLQGLRKATGAAIELDRKAFDILKHIDKEEKQNRMKERRLPLIIGWLGVVGEISLNIIPGGGIVQSVVALKRGASLYRETQAILRAAR